MFCRRILEFGIIKPKLLVQSSSVLLAHTETCAIQRTKNKDNETAGVGKAICPPKSASSSRGAPGGPPGTAPVKLVRAEHSGKCRMGFIPEEWFLFLKPITGVSGPYFLMLGVVNYLVSKEIYVMEHEYYLGLSQFIMVYYVITRFGPKLAAWLDKEVDAIVDDYEQGRKDEVAVFEKIKKDAELAKWRAEGQKLLMDAKKENIKMQLEAFYRERLLMVSQRIRARMDYQVKRHRALNRIHQKWMLKWILEHVRQSITAEFKKQAMTSAIQDLATLATRSK